MNCGPKCVNETRAVCMEAQFHLKNLNTFSCGSWIILCACSLMFSQYLQQWHKACECTHIRAATLPTCQTLLSFTTLCCLSAFPHLKISSTWWSKRPVAQTLTLPLCCELTVHQNQSSSWWCATRWPKVLHASCR